MNSVWQRNFLGLCGLFAIGAMSVALAEDKITMVKGEILSGTVRGESTKDGIKVEVREKGGPGGTRTLKPEEITEIEWDLDLTEWREAMSAFKKGSYKRASDLIGQIIEDPELFGQRSEAKAYVMFMHAESLYRSQKIAESLASFEKFMAAHPNSIYAAQAFGSIIDVAIQKKDTASAEKYLGELRKGGGEQKALADYYHGKLLLEALNKPADADVKFASAAKASSVPSTQGMALMGQANCAIAANNLAKARELATRALGANPPPSVAASAHLVVGNALMAEADKVGAPESEQKLVDALLSYLRVPIQYGGDRATEPEALYKAGECLQKLYKQYRQTRGNDRNRALYMYGKLADDVRYRSTEWANLARKGIAQLK
jgi:tetratricopeptide (TPR) repeat protein